MKPPISVRVRTDNMHTCGLELVGADGVATCVTIPNDGNVYQGLYRAREGLEKAINDLLASHGIVAAEEPPAISGESLAADTEPPPAFDPEATQP